MERHFRKRQEQVAARDTAMARPRNQNNEEIDVKKGRRMRRCAVNWLSLSVVASLFLPLTAQTGAVSPDALYQALLKAPLPAMPPGFHSAAVTPIPQKEAGLVGEVDLVFQGNDPKARLGLFVLTDFKAASEFNRKHLPPFTRGQKLLAYPPMARCIEVPGQPGYCDQWIQDFGVIMVATASKEDGATELMGFGFKHL